MDFNFTQEQEQLREAVRKWVERGYSFERRRSIVAAGGFDREVWQELAELGLTGLTVAEEHGGMGMGPIESMVVLEELGRGMVLEPLSQALIAAAVMSEGAQAEVADRWLPELANGGALVVLAYQESASRYALDGFKTVAEEKGDGYVLSGHKSLVPAGDKADACLVAATLDGRTALLLVEQGAQGMQASGYLTQDGSRAAELRFDNTPAQLVCADGAAALGRAALVGIASVCAEGVGVMDKAVPLTADYLNQRKQFGVPIASFQVLRHRMADMKMQLELARSMSYYAWLKLASGEPASQTVALSRAKYQLGESMRYVGQQSVQLHGGIGVTDEYIGSHYFKRLTQLGLLWGDSMHHLGIVSGNMEETAGVFV